MIMSIRIITQILHYHSGLKMKRTKIATALAVILAAKFSYAAEQTMTVSGNILGDSRAEEVKTWAGSRTVISNDQLEKRR